MDKQQQIQYINTFIKWLEANPELMKVLLDVRITTEIFQPNTGKSIWRKRKLIERSTQKRIREVMNDFFSSYFSTVFVDETYSILNGTNTYFIDPKTRKSKIFFNKDGKNFVAHFGNDNFLKFYVSVASCLEDYLLTAHELAHAMSSNMRYIVDKIRTNEEAKVVYVPENDCVTEIESLIMEKLFVRYLFKKGVIDEAGVASYLNSMGRSLCIESRTIIGGDGKISKDIWGYDRPNNKERAGDYMFRYIVGRIVSDQWIKKYSSLNDNGRKQMIADYEKFLKIAHKTPLDSACQFLLGKDFINVAQDFVDDIKKEQENDNTPPDRKYGVWDKFKSQIGKAGEKRILSCLPTKKRNKTDEKSQ